MKLTGPVKPRCGELRAHHPGLGDEALLQAHGERAVDVALEAATAAVEPEGEGVAQLIRGQAEHASGGGNGTEHGGDPGRVEPVVHLLGEVEAGADLGADGEGGKERAPVGAPGELCGGERCGYDGGPDVHPGSHRVTEVERPAHRAVQQRRRRRRQPVAVHERRRFGAPAAVEQQLTQRRDAVLASSRHAGRQRRQQHPSHDLACVCGDVVVRRRRDELDEA